MNYRNAIFFLLICMQFFAHSMEQIEETFEFVAGNDSHWTDETDMKQKMREAIHNIDPEELSRRGYNVSPAECERQMGFIQLHQTKTYEPEELDDEDSNIFWIIVHGTWGRQTSVFYKDNDPYYEGIKECAQAYAEAKKKRLKLMSFRWSGENNNQARIVASWCLFKFLYTTDPERHSEVVIIGHSHGCNVANCLTHHVKKEQPIDLLIYLACPHRSEWQCQPLSYKCLLYFLSNGDWVASPASVSFTQLKKNIATSLGIQAVSLLTQQVVGEGNTSRVTSQFGNVLTDRFLDKSQKQFEACQLFEPRENSITVGIRVEVKNYRVGHAEIETVACQLKNIITQLHDTYPFYYGTSSLFHLDLDYQDENPIILSVIKPGNLMQHLNPEAYLTFKKNRREPSEELEQQLSREAEIRYIERNRYKIPDL